MTFPVLSANGPSGYNLTRSLRTRSSASAYLSRTPASASNRTTWTWSGWVKRGAISSATMGIFGVDGSTSYMFITFNNSGSNNELDCGELATTQQWRRVTTQVFRDPSAWYHIVFAFDSTQATAGNRIKIYVNGTQVTSFSTSVDPPLNYSSIVNTATAHSIGRVALPTGYYLDGYFTEVNFIDGQQLTPSSFGSTSATTGVWQPARYTGTYGTNGFYLPFTDNSALTTASNAGLGKDFSGNANYWVTNNISITAGATYDSMTDVPTLTSSTAANFAVMNPLWQGRTNSPTNGNLDYPASSIGIGTMDVSQFSSYWEITSTGGTTTTSVYSTSAATTVGVTTGLTYGFRFNSSTGALDYTTNGSSFTSLATSLTSGPYFVYVSTAASTTASFNGGQRPFTYTAPSGFVALNTYNLPASTVPNGAAYMAATLYTGTLLSNTISNAVGSASFQPDFVWLKSRSAATDHKLTDVVRGVTKGLISNTTGAETTDTQGLTAFGSTGFTVGTNTDYNNLAATYVAWQWKGGGTAVSNTNGTITSSVSANTTSGCSVVTYTGTGANATVGHGLGVAPKMIIAKRREAAQYWPVYHASLASDQLLQLEVTLGAQTQSNVWTTTAPTSSVFSIGTAAGTNASAGTYVAYCFAAIKGFSAFGSYTGNGSTDGPFVYTGFSPRFVLVKCSSDAESWIIVDSARDPTNDGTQARLFPDTTSADSTVAVFDFLANGFKNTRGGAATPNVSGRTYIYMAFAQNPFQNALAY